MDITSIWASPVAGQPPNIADLVNAPDMDAMAEASFAFWQAHADAQDAMLHEFAEGQDDFPVLRLSLVDRVLAMWDGVVDMLFYSRNRRSTHSAARPFSFQLPMAMTRPTMELSFEYEEIFAQTAAFRSALAVQISAVRGAAYGFVVSDDALDAALEDDCDTTDFAHTLSGITHYWPPTDGAPAIALSEMQEDGGLPIEIAFIAHSPDAHVEMLARLRDEFDGRLVERSP